MRVGWVGLGKLGLPCALVLANSGHDVTGYDVNPRVAAFLAGDASALPWVEPGVDELVRADVMHVVEDVGQVVDRSDVIFIAVQTPHAPRFGGETPTPDETRDFEYGYLVQAVRDVAREALYRHRSVTLVVVSTVLPGTTGRELRPHLNPYTRLVYSPQFIAMGSTIYDFRNPEFLLMGSDDGEATTTVDEVFKPVHSARRLVTSVENAELIKVAYNTFISMKIVWANHLMQVCDGVGADVDEVFNALRLATQRLVSPAYMRGGMGDGGACHPRDLIALADLERRLDAPNFYHYLSLMRDAQTEWLAKLVKRWSEQSNLPVTVLGRAYKPGVSLTDGSPALLLAHYLREDGVRFHQYDPLVDRTADAERIYGDPRVFVIATRQDEFTRVTFPPGSVVIDPWGCVMDQRGVTTVRVGRR